MADRRGGTTAVASVSRMIVWTRRLVPAALGAALLYLAWRIISVNGELVKVDFLIGRVELALWKALLTAFVCGAGLVGLFAFYQMARTGLVSRGYRKKLARLETEVHQLRNLPLVEAQPQALEAQPQALVEAQPQARDDDPTLGGVRGSGT